VSCLFCFLWIVVSGLVLQKPGEVRIQAIWAAMKVDMFKVGDQLTELAEIEENDLTSSPFAPNSLLSHGHSLEKIEVDAL